MNPLLIPSEVGERSSKVDGKELTRRYEEGERDFEGADLREASLTGVNLSGVSLSGRLGRCRPIRVYADWCQSVTVPFGHELL